MPVHTLPEGYVWLEDAFERAWSEIEDAERYTVDAAESCDSDDDDAGRQGWRGFDESKERVERPMRAALASGALRAFIRDPQTGEAAELGDRHLWDRPDRTFRGLGLGNYPDEMITHGPYTGDRPVFVSKRELEVFIRSHSPATDGLAQAELIDRTPWEVPAGVDAAALADLCQATRQTAPLTP